MKIVKSCGNCVFLFYPVNTVPCKKCWNSSNWRLRSDKTGALEADA